MARNDVNQMDVDATAIMSRAASDLKKADQLGWLTAEQVDEVAARIPPDGHRPLRDVVEELKGSADTSTAEQPG